MADLEGIGKLCTQRGILYIVDSTMTTPALFQPKAVGASLVVHSLSKSICGHGNALGGSAGFRDTCGSASNIAARAAGSLAGAEGQGAPGLLAREVRRGEGTEMLRGLAIDTAPRTIRLVPMATATSFVGTLALADGEPGEDPLMEAYASRAAAAYLHAARTVR